MKKELKQVVLHRPLPGIPRWLRIYRPDLYNYVIETSIRYPAKNIMEKIYISINGEPPKCSCGNYRKFNTFSTGYRIGCNLGNKCLDVATNRVNKQQETLMNRYGVDNSAKLQSAKEKTRITNMEKYGVIHHSQNNLIKEKTMRTRNSRSDKENNQIKEKTKQSNLLKYGVDHHMKLISQQDKVKNTNMQRFGVSFPLQNEKSFKKMKESCKLLNISKINETRKQTIMEKYGVDAASKIPLSNLALEILSDKDKFIEYIKGKERNEVVNELEIHEHTLYLYAKRYNATLLFKRPLLSNFEREIAHFLNELQIEFIQNDRSLIMPKEIDFLIINYNLAIECCGLYWHSENSAGKDRNYHYSKYIKCKEKGFTLLTIFQDEWEKSKDKVKNRILMFLKISNNKIYARDTIVKEISTKEAEEFINKNHLQSYATAKIKLGLFDKQDNLCAVMTFDKPRFTKKYEYELVRYCANQYIIGGSEKLFKYFINNFEPKSIISYSDNRYFNGSMYKKLKFIEQGNNIGYFYTDYHDRFNRLQFQKHKLVEQGHDKSKTEWQIMQDLGYDRIWDCGQTTWIFNK